MDASGVASLPMMTARWGQRALPRCLDALRGNTIKAQRGLG
jgi:hypothetical protein